MGRALSGAVCSIRDSRWPRGRPVIQLEVGTPWSPDVIALARAARLLDTGHASQAVAIFRRYTSPEAQLGLAFAEWTGPASLAKVEQIANANPDDPGIRLNLG